MSVLLIHNIDEKSDPLKEMKHLVPCHMASK